MRRILPFLVLITALFLVACASYEGRGLKPGLSTEADVRQLMGEPAAVWPISPGDGRLLAYPRGPRGTQTFMVSIDSSGKLTAIRQVLDEKYFSKVTRGMSGEAVSRLIGPPFETMPFPRRNEIAWDYRFEDTWGYLVIFSVIFGEDGNVKTTVRAREEADDRSPF